MPYVHTSHSRYMPCNVHASNYAYIAVLLDLLVVFESTFENDEVLLRGFVVRV